MTDVPSLQIGGVPIINLNTPHPTYPAQSYTAHPSQQQGPPSYGHNQTQQQQTPAPSGTSSSTQPASYLPQHLQKSNDQRAMSVEMMDVSGLSLSSPVVPSSAGTGTGSTSMATSTLGYTDFKAEIQGGADVQSPVPEGMMRQPSAEEERLKDKVREAQEQVRAHF